MTSAASPEWSAFSGRQVEIRFGAQRAVIVEVGGGLREYDVDGQAVLAGYGPDSMALGGRALPLLPWPNRITDGQYAFEGQQLQLPINEVARHNAIHGFTAWMNWNVAEQTADRVRMAVTTYPRPGYPFGLDLSIEYTLNASGLTIRTTAHNFGKSALPFGAGTHPYVTVGTPLVDSASLAFEAESRLELDSVRRVPTGQVLPVAGSELDFRVARPIGALVLDDCFTGLARDAGGVARVAVSDPGSGRAVVVWMDASYPYAQIFSGDTLPVADRRRSLAIEPMTCPPDAFRSGTDVIVLQPDESHSMEFGFTPQL